MCDHGDVTQIKLQSLQISDGFKRYSCRSCNDTIKTNDVNFNRLYTRHYDLCMHKNMSTEHVVTYKNSDGKNSCTWCGEEITPQ